MNWKNLNLATKLGVSFGSIMVLFLVLALLMQWNMQTVSKHSSELSDEYIPIAELSNDISRTAQQAMYAQRGYRYTEGKAFLEEGQQHLTRLRTLLDQAEILTSEHANLAQVKETVTKTRAALDEYEGFFTETVEVNGKIGQNREKIESLQAELEGETTRLVQSVQRSLENRYTVARYREQVKLNEIQQLLSGAYISYYRSRTLDKPEMLQEAASKLELSTENYNLLAGSNVFPENRDTYSKLSILTSEVSEAMKENQRHGARLIELGAARRVSSNTLLEDFHTVAVKEMSTTKDISENNIQLIKRMSARTLVGIITILIISLVFSYYITRALTNPIKKSMEFAQKIAAGDLTATIDIDQEDEIGKLTKELKIMGLKLRQIINEVIHGAGGLAAAANQISTSAQQLSENASEQASSVEEVSSSMEEMVANIEQNTENARQTEKISIMAAAGVTEGNQATGLSVNAMKNIAGKISIIGEIAFQTNILALNAAVEAARAGEHGRGFAVVAAEVRKLAERSKIAADEINQLSGNGVHVAEDAGKKLEQIVPEIERTAKLVQEITASSLEQNAGADQINNAIQQLNHVTQQNAATSEELATSSEQLASHAVQLRELVSFFKI
jgi:methyl-accepting chemotaxis protein